MFFGDEKMIGVKRSVNNAPLDEKMIGVKTSVNNAPLDDKSGVVSEGV